MRTVSLSGLDGPAVARRLRLALEDAGARRRGLHKDLFERKNVQSLVRTINRFAADLPRTSHAMQDEPRPVEHLVDRALRYVRRHRRRLIHQPL